MKKFLFLLIPTLALISCAEQEVEYMINFQAEDAIKEIREKARAGEGKHYCGNLDGYTNLRLFYSTGGTLIELKEDEYHWCDDVENGGVSFVFTASKDVVLIKLEGDFTVDIPLNDEGAYAIYRYENRDINYGEYCQYKENMKTGYFTMEATYHVPIGKKQPDSDGFVHGKPYKYQFIWY